MTWRGVGIVYALLAVLVAAALLLERKEPPAPAAGDRPRATESLLGMDAAAVDTIAFVRGDTMVRATREDDRWNAVAASGARLSPDLIAATLATLTTGQAAEVLVSGTEGDLAAYGLDTPTATVQVVMRDLPKGPIMVSVGARNPTRTAVYARRSDRPGIYLVGMNLPYYIELIFDAAKG